MVRTANVSFRNLAPARPLGAGSISPALLKLQMSRDPPEPEAKAPPPAQPPPHLFPVLLTLAREILAIVGVDGQRHIGPAQVEVVGLIVLTIGAPIPDPTLTQPLLVKAMCSLPPSLEPTKGGRPRDSYGSEHFIFKKKNRPHNGVRPPVGPASCSLWCQRPE